MDPSSSSSLSIDCQRSTRRRRRRRGNRAGTTGEDKILPINRISSIKDGSIGSGLKEAEKKTSIHPCCLTALTTQEFATENEAMSPHGFPGAASGCVALRRRGRGGASRLANGV